MVDFSTALPNFKGEINVIRNRCLSNLIKRRLCYIDIEMSFNNEETIDENLYFFPIISENNPDGLLGTVGLESSEPSLLFQINVNESYADALINSSNAIIKSSELINFGRLVENQSISRRLYFTNSSKIFLPAPTVNSIPQGLSLINNTCSGNIKKESSCYLDLEYSYQGIIGSDNNVNDNLTFNSDYMTDTSINIAALNVSQEDPNSAKLSIQSINLPTKTKANEQIVRRVYITNISSQTFSFDSNEFLSGNASPLINTCLNKTISPNGICYLDFIFNSDRENSLVRAVIDIPSANVFEEFSGGGQFTGSTLIFNSLSDLQNGSFIYGKNVSQLTGGLFPDLNENLYFYDGENYLNGCCTDPYEVSLDQVYFGSLFVVQAGELDNGTATDPVTFITKSVVSKNSGSTFDNVITFNQNFYDNNNNAILGWENQENRIRDIYVVKAVDAVDANTKCNDPTQLHNYFEIEYIVGPGPIKLGEIDLLESNIVNFQASNPRIDQITSLQTIDLNGISISPGNYLMLNNVGPYGEFDAFGVCYLSANEFNPIVDKTFNVVLEDNEDNLFQAFFDPWCYIDINTKTIFVNHDFNFYKSTTILEDPFSTNRFANLVVEVNQLIIDDHEANKFGQFSPDYSRTFTEGIDYNYFGIYYFNILP